MVEKIGKYRIHRLIGRGGMAEVYEAEELEAQGSHRRVCIKKIRREFSSHPTFLKSFESEARIVANLQHPNIVQLFDTGREDGEMYLVMEYVEGMDLSSLLRGVDEQGLQVPMDFAVHVMEGLLAALDHAHTRIIEGKLLPVIHRDISPHNILVSADGVIKLADFGIAKAKGISETTEEGIIKGKLAYLSPEQVKHGGKGVGPASDLFSSGVLFWETLTCDRLFKATMEHQLVAKVLSFTEASLPIFSPEINRFLAGLLAPEPEDRFRSAGAALRALKETGIAGCGRANAATIVTNLRRNKANAALIESGTPKSGFASAFSLLRTIPNLTGRTIPFPTRTDTTGQTEQNGRGGLHNLRLPLAIALTAVFLIALAVFVPRIKRKYIEKRGSPIPSRVEPELELEPVIYTRESSHQRDDVLHLISHEDESNKQPPPVETIAPLTQPKEPIQSGDKRPFKTRRRQARNTETKTDEQNTDGDSHQSDIDRLLKKKIPLEPLNAQ